MKNQKGITLIALVITIIVLLILAGVSIAMLTGENGILNKATTSVSETAIAEAKEAAQLEVNAKMADYYEAKYATDGSTTYADFAAYLTADPLTTPAGENRYSVSGNTVTITANGETGTIGDKGGITWNGTSGD